MSRVHGMLKSTLSQATGLALRGLLLLIIVVR